MKCSLIDLAHVPDSFCLLIDWFIGYHSKWVYVSNNIGKSTEKHGFGLLQKLMENVTARCIQMNATERFVDGKMKFQRAERMTLVMLPCFLKDTFIIDLYTVVSWLYQEWWNEDGWIRKKKSWENLIRTSNIPTSLSESTHSSGQFIHSFS